MKKHWVDKELKKAFGHGILAGTAAILLVKILYMVFELYLGGDIRSFYSKSTTWYLSLLASIGLVGLIEEGVKAMVSHIVCLSNKDCGYRPTFTFVTFASCALTFSLLENIEYYFSFGPEVVLPRVLISSVAHLSFSLICSYFSSVAFAFNKPIKTVFILNFGIVLASVLHGTFNFMLFQYSTWSVAGFILALFPVFAFILREIWVQAMKFDIPPEGFMAVCTSCRALIVERIRFCPFCGQRLVKLESLPTIIKPRE